MRKKDFSEEDIKIIKEMYLNNISIDDILLKFNIGKTTLYRLLDKQNIPRNKKYYNNVDKKEMVKMYNDGIGCNTIGKTFGVSSGGVILSLKNMGVEIRSKKVELKISKDDIKTIKYLYENNDMWIKDIADIYNVNTRVIRYHLKRMNIKIREDRTAEDLKEEIKNMYNGGYKIREIAQCFKMASGTVSDCLKVMNVDLKKHKHFNKTTSKEEDKKICDMYLNSDLSSNKIADIMNLGDITVLRILKSNGIEANKHIKIKQEDYGIIKRMYCEGCMSSNAIAKQFNVSQMCVLDVLKKMNIKMISHGGSKRTLKITDEDKVYMRQMRKEGKSYTEIAEGLSISKGTIAVYLRSIGEQYSYSIDDSKNCGESFGECFCRKTLKEIFNKEFVRCRPFHSEHGGKLELDGYNEEIKLAFEYQGEQHYVSNNYFGGDEYFEKLKKRDKEKKKACIDNGIALIEIPYFVPLGEIKNFIMNFLECSVF